MPIKLYLQKLGQGTGAISQELLRPLPSLRKPHSPATWVSSDVVALAWEAPLSQLSGYAQEGGSAVGPSAVQPRGALKLGSEAPRLPAPPKLVPVTCGHTHSPRQPGPGHAVAASGLGPSGLTGLPAKHRAVVPPHQAPEFKGSGVTLGGRRRAHWWRQAPRWPRMTRP